jgi:hypothetical protein
MRTTINLTESAVATARSLAKLEGLSLGAAVSALIDSAAKHHESKQGSSDSPELLGRFALLPVRDEVITPQQIRALEAQPSAYELGANLFGRHRGPAALASGRKQVDPKR